MNPIRTGYAVLCIFLCLAKFSTGYAQKVNISGALHNDVNALLDAHVNGSGLGKPSNTVMYAYLVNGIYIVAKHTLNDADGSFIFNDADSASSYTIRISSINSIVGASVPVSTLPVGWIAAGESFGEHNAAGTGVETGIPDLQIPVYTFSQDISNIRFGIQQLPESAMNHHPSEGNPGGYNTFRIPATAFQISNVGLHPSTQDYSGGTVDSIRIISFPTGINFISINGVIYANGSICPPVTICMPWPAGGITVPATDGITTWPLLIDPIDGNISPIISFVAIDNAHFEDPSPGSVTIPFKTITVTGNVWGDANGDLHQNGVEEVINGTNTGTGLKTGLALFVNLLDKNDIVIASAPVQNNGVYTLPAVPAYNASLTAQLSNIQGNTGSLKPVNTVPEGWVITGENKNGQGGIADVSADGEISLTTLISNINQQNFGIERLPDSDLKNQHYAINIPGQIFQVPALTGSDPEDGISSTGGRFKISSLPTGAVLYYNNVAVTAGQIIDNYDPALLQIDPNNLAKAASFTYAILDAASRIDPTPAVVNLFWTTVLDLEVSTFNGVRSLNENLLRWSTDFELNTHHFVLEYSRDGINFTPLHSISARGNSVVRNNYQYLHKDPQGNVAYYRLKLYKLDGSVVTSSVVTIRSQARENIISVAPNPFVNSVTANIYFERAGKVNGTLINAAGGVVKRLTWTAVSGLNLLTLTGLEGLPAGTYILELRTEQIVERVKLIKAN